MSSSSASVPDISVVIPSHNEGDNLRRTVHNLLATMPATGEIVVVDDVSTDGSTDRVAQGYGSVMVAHPERRLGVAAARNLGASLARGQLLVFCDAHVEAPMNWVRDLCNPLRAQEVGIVGPAISAMGDAAMTGYGLTWEGPALEVRWLPQLATVSYPVPFLCGCFTALRREVFEDAGGFDDGMTTWGAEDAELGLRLWLLGYTCMVVPSVNVAHLFRPSFPYEVDWITVVHNLLRLGSIHFDQARFAQLTAAFVHHSAFPAALARLLEGDALARRAALIIRRRFDASWFFDRFGIALGGVEAVNRGG